MDEEKIKDSSNNYQVMHTQSLCPEYIKDFSEANLNDNIYDIKKILGEKYSSDYLQSLIPKLNYQILEDKNSDRPKIIVNNKEVSFEQITSFLLKKAIDNSEELYSQKVGSMVISVPNNFNNSKRQSIIDSAKIAGIQNIHLINDTTSALFYFIHNKYFMKKEYYLVIDLGAANFDLSLMEASPKGYIKVIYSSGYGYFGGDNLTECLFDYCINCFCNEYYAKKEIILENKENNLNLYNEVEKGKVNLIYQKSSFIHVDSFDGENDLDYTITREDFDTINNKNYQFILDSIDEVFTQSKFEINQLTSVILLGDNLKMPKLIELIKKKFEFCEIIIDYDEAVALGCGIFASKITNKIQDEKISKFKIYEITQLTLGVRTEGNLMSVILPRGTKIPIKCKKNFITTQDYQTKLKFEIYEGERKLIRDNKRLGGMILNNLPEKLKGQVKVDVTFEIDVDGVLKVTAIENSQNLTKEIKEINIGNMTQEEINKKIKEAEKLFKDDKNEENRIKSMLKLNDLLVNYTHKYSENEEIKKILDQFRNWLKHSTQLPKEEYDKKIEELNKSIPKENEKKGEEKKEKKNEETTEGKEKNIETSLEKNNENNINTNDGIVNENINEGQNNEVHTAV